MKMHFSTGAIGVGVGVLYDRPHNRTGNANNNSHIRSSIVMGIVEICILLRRSFIYQLRQFFDHSTLHGIKYITATQRSRVFRFLWFCLTSIATVAALVVIFSLWEKYENEPTITGLDSDVNNTAIVYPTVAICPHNNIDTHKLQQMAEQWAPNGNSSKMARLLTLLGTLSFDNMLEIVELTSDMDLQILRNYSLRAIAFELRESCNNLFVSCEFRGVPIDCCENFRLVYVETGVCYVFNSRIESTVQGEIDMQPKHYLYKDNLRWDLYLKPIVVVDGYVYTFDEHFIPDYQHGMSWYYNSIMEFRVLQQIFHTTDDAKDLSLSQRDCIFDNERNLPYYPGAYTLTACIKSCRMQMALKLCRCLPSFYKQIPGERVCAVADFNCLISHRKDITRLESCKQCLPNCRRIDSTIEQIGQHENADISKFAFIVNILSWPIYRYKTEIIFGWIDLLGAFGGIASLFIGFSLLSAVEIVYYFTMRACCMLYKNRQQLQEIEQRLRSRPPPRIDLSLDFKLIASASPRIQTSNTNHTNIKQCEHALIDRRLRADQAIRAHAQKLFTRPHNTRPFVI